MSLLSIRVTATLFLAACLLRCSADDNTSTAASENGGTSAAPGAGGFAGAIASGAASAGGASATSGAGGSADVAASAGGSATIAGAGGAGPGSGGVAGSAEPSAGGNLNAPYLKAYSKAPYETSSNVFTLKVNGTSVEVVRYYNLYSYAHLAYQGTATFTVSVKSGAAITFFDVSPHSYGLNATATKSGAELTFFRTQASSTYLIIKIKTSSGTLENLVIAADPEETDAPAIGGQVKDITAAPYNADRAGAGLMTTTIQSAIDDLSSDGGGTVYFPAGVYKFSNIRMKSNVTLYLAEGAVLRGSSDRADYIWNTSGTTNGNPTQGQQSIVIVGKATNVAIKGRGMIDANSTSLAAPATTGGKLDGFGGYRKGIVASRQAGSDRPDGITIEGVTFKDSTTWSFDIEDALNVTIKNVKLLNDYNWIHSDGFDLGAVTNGLVDNCLGVTGDDVFDAKGTSINPLSNVTYSNSVAYAMKGAGTKIGVQARGPGDDVSFVNIDVVSGYRGISISHDDGSGAWTNIHCTDIRVENIVGASTSGQFRVAPFVIWTADYGDAVGPMTGVALTRVNFENTANKKGIIQGHDATNKVSNVSLRGVTMDGVAIDSTNYTSKIDVGANVSNLTF